jgi:stage II sporulation protein D
MASGRRLALSIGWIASVLCLLACGSASARVEPHVRVLLYDDAEPVEVGPAAQPFRVSLGTGGRLVVDGRARSEPWISSGHGPWRVGDRVVRGEISVRSAEGRIQVLNRIGLEDYVASTVGGEMSSSWPAEALRAQAVAARTYVLYEAGRRREAPWDVRATATSQVYRGIDAESQATRSAARATEGQVLTWSGEPILAAFHSTAGGRTAAASEVWGEDLPYLRVVDVEGEDEAPHTYWRTAFRRDALARLLATDGVSVGELRTISVDRRTPSGRVSRLLVRGSKTDATLRGRELRDLLGELGLRSTLFEIRESPDGFVFVGSGYGHGVGMSQWGARAMAERGASYKRILGRFYPGTRLERISSHRLVGRIPREAGGEGGR